MARVDLTKALWRHRRLAASVSWSEDPPLFVSGHSNGRYYLCLQGRAQVMRRSVALYVSSTVPSSPYLAPAA